MSSKPNSKKPLFILLLLFVVPLAIAMLMFYGRAYLPHPHAKSHGELIVPVQHISTLLAHNEKNEDISLGHLLEHWTLVLVSDGSCNLQCEAALFKIRQARLLTGKDINRVKALLLLKQGSEKSPHLVEVLKRFSVVEMIEYQGIAFEDSRPGEFELRAGDIYIIDPQGNVMMRYVDQSTAKGILKDIKKLLRISNIG